MPNRTLTSIVMTELNFRDKYLDTKDKPQISCINAQKMRGNIKFTSTEHKCTTNWLHFLEAVRLTSPRVPAKKGARRSRKIDGCSQGCSLTEATTCSLMLPGCASHNALKEDVNIFLLNKELLPTWLASIGAETKHPSASIGHLGHLILCQKLWLVSFSVPTAPVLVVSILDTGGQSNVAEQLGHDKRRGSQVLNL